MKILLNNCKEIIDKSELTVEDLLSYKKYTFKMLVVKINGKIVAKKDYPVTKIFDGDIVMVLHLMSGG